MKKMITFAADRADEIKENAEKLHMSKTKYLNIKMDEILDAEDTGLELVYLSQLYSEIRNAKGLSKATKEKLLAPVNKLVALKAGKEEL